MTLREEWLKRLFGWMRPPVQPDPVPAGDADQASNSAASHKAPVKLAAKVPAKHLQPVARGVGPLADARLRQRVSTAFGASRPVQERDGLCGRDRKLAELLDGVRYRRNHAVICGPRGSGKTSLVRIFGDYADEDGAVVLYMAGSDDASFNDLLTPYLKQIPAACCAPGVQPKIAEAAERERLTASRVVELLAEIKYAQVILIFDEFDRTSRAETKAELTTLMKLTSDACLKVSYVIVGIAENVRELITGHPSLRRHLSIVTVEPLADEAIGRILSECFESCGMVCEQEAMAMLVASSCGSPYHARLFGMHGALEAISTGAKRIKPRHVRAGLRAAFTEWRAGNPADAAVFDRIAQSGEDNAKIVRLARIAAYRHAGADAELAISPELQQEDDGSLEPPPVLQPLLNSHTNGIEFKDSLAPQFLLIALRMGGTASVNKRVEATT